KEIGRSTAGVTLGKPLSISEDGASAPVFRAKNFGAPMAATPTPVAQGEETLSITVNVTWAIKAGP
ncbi:MAG: SIMPL domain-containing protein, partial [Bradyrhizobium sp.]|nr:SIMPL domain-containing protein [Bradyrhizobium sp.]